MTIYPADIPRKVNQLGDDVLEIYTMISEVQDTQRAHSVRLDRMEGRLDGIDGRLGGIDGRLDGIDGRLGGMQGSLDGLTAQMSVVVAALVKNDD